MNRETRLSIATLIIASFMIGTDFTGVLLLVSPIENAYSADITTSQWVLNVFALTFAVLMVAGGRLGDMYGRRRLMLVGLAVLFASAIGCLLAPSIGWLIGARAVQGFGAAILWPSILALGATIVEKSKQGFVMGLILTGITTGNVCGPLISGVVVSLGDWRLFFLVNAVLAVLVTVLVWTFLPKEPPVHTNERVDYAGAIILAGAIVALLYGLDVGADWGWGSTPLLALLAVSAILFVAFRFVERRVKDPMVPPALLGNREFMLTLAANGLVVPAIFVGFLYFPQYMQKVMGWTVLESSFGMLPMLVLSAVGSLTIGHFYDAVGPRRLLFIGYLLAALGAASVIVLTDPSWRYLALVPAMVLIGLGASIAIGSAGTVTISTVAPSRAGLAGGLSFTVHLALGAIGVAGATAIMYATSLASLKNGLSQAGITMSLAEQKALNGAAPEADAVSRVLANHSAQTAETVHTLLIEAFANGMSRAYWLTFVLAVIGLFVVIAIDEEKLRRVEG